MSEFDSRIVNYIDNFHICRNFLTVSTDNKIKYIDFEFKVTNIDANDACKEYVILQCGMLLCN